MIPLKRIPKKKSDSGIKIPVIKINTVVTMNLIEKKTHIIFCIKAAERNKKQK